MPQTATAPRLMPRLLPRLLAVTGGAVLVAALAGTTLLWVHYGSTVFFEIIAAGIAACF